MEEFKARETFVRKLIPDVAEEVLALRVGGQKLLISFSGKSEVTVDVAPLEAEVEDAPLGAS